MMKSILYRQGRAYLRQKRLYSSLVSTSQEAALDDWIQRTHGVQQQYHDELSRSKVADLFCTLPTRAHKLADHVHAHTPLQPLHTLAFFHPRTPEAQLGADQTNTDFCPPAPFARRMWAGGAFRFPRASDAGLRVSAGAGATARAKVVKVEKKGFERGMPMVFVHQNIEYEQGTGEGPAVVEERIHVYLPKDARADRRAVREVTGLPKPQYTFSWTPTPTTLFRFSALTWNAHLIHLDQAYAQNAEGYPERLVHGPLTALMLVEALFHKAYAGRIDNFVYRARNPVFVGRRQHVCGALSPGGGSAALWAEDDDGVVSMTGTVDLLDQGWKTTA
ncbi:hypothetical protein M0805_001786 [Coniferiporia weirii]|nr:hypothetical protein M0805_001786 [Coniferiporia weirii]